MLVFFNLTFLPMFSVGLRGMNRRVATYTYNLQSMNVFISLMAFGLGLSFLPFIVNMLWSLVRGPLAEANPWGARTLEWQTSSPPPVENFPTPPIVTGYPYDYGVKDAPPYGLVAATLAAGD
jgi:cytochrome c oxidase subunit 1